MAAFFHQRSSPRCSPSSSVFMDYNRLLVTSDTRSVSWSCINMLSQWSAWISPVIRATSFALVQATAAKKRVYRGSSDCLQTFGRWSSGCYTRYIHTSGLRCSCSNEPVARWSEIKISKFLIYMYRISRIFFQT